MILPRHIPLVLLYSKQESLFGMRRAFSNSAAQADDHIHSSWRLIDNSLVANPDMKIPFADWIEARKRLRVRLQGGL